MTPIEALKEDFAQTLRFIDKCDEHIFKIKNWALVTTSAVIAFSVSQGKGGIALWNIVLLIGFIYLELIYKSFQDTAIKHTTDISERIDKHLKGSEGSALLDGYSHSFGRKLQYPSVRHVFSIICNRQRWHILYFYTFLVAVSVGAHLVTQRTA